MATVPDDAESNSVTLVHLMNFRTANCDVGFQWSSVTWSIRLATMESFKRKLKTFRWIDIESFPWVPYHEFYIVDTLCHRLYAIEPDAGDVTTSAFEPILEKVSKDVASRVFFWRAQWGWRFFGGESSSGESSSGELSVKLRWQKRRPLRSFRFSSNFKLERTKIERNRCLHVTSCWKRLFNEKSFIQNDRHSSSRFTGEESFFSSRFTEEQESFLRGVGVTWE